jgi:DNA-binding XRE family transcriptional regulator
MRWVTNLGLAVTSYAWHDARMATDDARQRLGELVAARRKQLGLGKEAAARLANISSITWKRIEDGLTVRDPSYVAASMALGWEPNAMEDYLVKGVIPREQGTAEEYIADAPDPVVETMLETIRREHPDWLYRWATRVVDEHRNSRSATKRNRDNAS